MWLYIGYHLADFTSTLESLVRDAVQKGPTMIAERRRQEGDILPFVGHLMRLPDFEFGLEFELEEKTNGKLTQGIGTGVRYSYVHNTGVIANQHKRSTKQNGLWATQNEQQEADTTRYVNRGVYIITLKIGDENTYVTVTCKKWIR